MLHGWHAPKGRDYVIIERAPNAGSFFEKNPVHRKLISLNKRNTGYGSNVNSPVVLIPHLSPQHDTTFCALMSNSNYACTACIPFNIDVTTGT